MAPLPENLTPRFRVNYANLSREHSFQIRSNESPATIGTQVEAFLGALGPLMAPSIVGTIEFAPSGSNIFNPVTTGAEGFSFGSADAPLEARAWYVNFVGRSSGGRRAKLFIFGAALLGSNYRWIVGENEAVDDAIAVLQTFPSGWQAIDGIVPVWKNYANAGVHDHIAKDLRTS